MIPFCQYVSRFIKSAVKTTRFSHEDDDFKKIDPTDRVSMLFDAIPAQLNKSPSRYQVSSVLENNRADSILKLLAEINSSQTVLISYQTNDSSAGLATNKDLTRFKLFIYDTRLFVTFDCVTTAHS